MRAAMGEGVMQEGMEAGLTLKECKSCRRGDSER